MQRFKTIAMVTLLALIGIVGLTFEVQSISRIVSSVTFDRYSYTVWYDTEYMPVARYRAIPPCELFTEGTVNGLNNQQTAVLACKGDTSVPPTIQQIDNYSDYTLWHNCHANTDDSACSAYYNQ